jgi:uncharacterized protein YndB with AHSA1/START domain
MTIADEVHVELCRRLTATPQQVFAAFSEARLVSRWLTPSPDIALTVLQFDFRVGGIYRFAYRLPEGTTVIVGGSYQAIDPPSKIAFTWVIEPPDEHAGIESLVTVAITPDGGGTELRIRHEKLRRRDAVTRHAEGWRGALDRLATLFDLDGRQHEQ